MGVFRNPLVLSHRQRLIVIAIILVIVITIPSYYLFAVEKNSQKPLSVIKASNATTVYDWAENFSNASRPSYFLNGSGDQGGVPANSTMIQPGFPVSTLNVTLRAENDPPPSEMLSFALNITGKLYLNPLPANITIQLNDTLPGLLDNPFIGNWVNVSFNSVETNLAIYNLNNKTDLSTGQYYYFHFLWGDFISVFPTALNHTYPLEFKVTLGGLYVPVYSRILLDYTDVKS